MKLCAKFQEDSQKIETRFQENKEHICTSFCSGVIVGGSARVFQKEVSVEDTLWVEVSNVFKYTIPSTEHKFKKVLGVNLEILNSEENHYENADFTYKIYHSGAVTIVLDKKVDCRIIIQGE